MKKQTKITILAFALLLATTSTSQAQGSFEVAIMSPETATLGKFGSYPASNYTGSVDINLPLYLYKSHEVEIPVSLSYDASGFMPNKESGKVGQNWVLNAGGVITRAVNGVPDEQQAYLNDPDDFHAHGLWYGIKTLGVRYDENKIKTMQQLELISNVETSPDMFTFNFGGHHGRFLIGHDGRPRVIADRAYKIDLGGFATQTRNGFTVVSSLKITTDDGTVYTFGGNRDALEISLYKKTDHSGNVLDQLPNGTINGFYLTKIQTTDGHVVNFTYKNFTTALTAYIDGNNILKMGYFNDYRNRAFGAANTAIYSYNPNEQYSLTKMVYLTEISSTTGKVSFGYSTKASLFHKGFRSWLKPTLKLDNIIATNSAGDVVKSVGFKQTFVKATLGDVYRMYLDELYVGREKYVFAYTDRSALPRPITRGVDLQGYYNGKDSNTNLDALHFTEMGVSDFSHRQPNFTYASKGVLKSITYPTGGKTEFTFENHRYGTVVRRYPAYPYVVLLLENKDIGGLRIKQIKNTPGETRNFTYTTDASDLTLGDDEISSGIFNDDGKYNFIARFNHIGFGITTWIVSSGDNILASTSYGEPCIEYSRVTETVGDGTNGKTQYNFTNFLTHPNLFSLGSNTYSFYSGRIPTDAATKNLLLSMLGYTSQKAERGKLVSEVLYKADGNAKMETLYTYSVNKQDSAIYDSGIRFVVGANYGIANSVAYYYHNKTLDSKKVIEYSSNGNMETTTTYLYNTKNRLPSQVTVTDSQGNSRIRKFYYPVDYPTTSPWKEMTARHIVAPVIQEDEQKGTTRLRSTKTNYKLYCNNKFYAPSLIQQAIGNGAYQTLCTFHNYGERKTLLSYAGRDGYNVTYTWGYNNQYPISVVKDGQVTTYEYKPSVGMTSVTAPNDLKTTYEYDLYGRLVSVKNHDGDVINKMEYSHAKLTEAITLSLSGGASYPVGSGTFTATPGKGSGQYKFDWILKRAGTVINSQKNSTAKAVTFNLPSTGSYVLTCTMTDIITFETKTVNHSFSVVASLAPIQFNNVTIQETPSTGYKKISAVISCTESTTVNFTVDYRLRGTGTQMKCRIGSTTKIYTGEGSAPITVTLPAGNTAVSMDISNYMVEGESTLTILSTTNGAPVGTPSTLNISY